MYKFPKEDSNHDENINSEEALKAESTKYHFNRKLIAIKNILRSRMDTQQIESAMKEIELILND